MNDDTDDRLPVPPAAPAHHGPLTRRWTEQRWTLDNTIRSV